MPVTMQRPEPTTIRPNATVTIARDPRIGWPLSLLIAAVASVGAVTVMFWLRSTYQIRTLPERVMEWVLIYVSPDTLEQGLAQFGAQAKVYALYVAVAGMGLILFGLGTALVRYARSPWALFGAGPALFLVAMGVIMPMTGAGFFGVDLLQDWRLVNAGYLAVALSYALLLVLGRWAARSVGTASGSVDAPAERTVTRRAALSSLGSTLAVAAATLWLGQRSGLGSSNLPLARVQITPRPADAAASASAGTASGATAPATTAAAVGPAVAAVPPAVAASPAALQAAAPAAAAQSAATGPGAGPTGATSAGAPSDASPVAAAPPPAPPAPPAAAASSTYPTPPKPAMQLARDQEGAAVGGSRQPGTLASLITRTEDHYHVTKNPVADPVIAPETWTLALDGEVNSPVQLDYATLRQLPSVEVAKTLECVSNLTDKCELVPFGGELIGTARWTGVRLVDVLELAGGLKPGVVTVALIGEDEFVSAVPPEVVQDPNTILAYEMNGQVIPYEHGYPARILTPGRYGYKSPKWIRVIRPSRREVVDWYGQRNWSRDGIVRTMTRIDLPAPGASIQAGQQRIAGIAYASNRGIAKVEFSADGGQNWTEATFIEPQPGVDAWVRWEGSFDLPAGATLTLVARATDGQGTLQTEQFSLAQPNGASGWNSIQVTGA